MASPELVASAHTDTEGRGELSSAFIKRLTRRADIRNCHCSTVLATGEPMLIHDPDLELEGEPRPDEEILHRGAQTGDSIPDRRAA